jgi:peptide/nickel transport system substrate-binding protein
MDAEVRRPIRVAIEDTLTSLRPEGFSSMTDVQIGLQMYETLVGYDRHLRLEGRLAESWERSPDGLTYRFALRPSTVFHDGKRITAEAVRDLLASSLLERNGIRELTASVDAIGPAGLEVRLRRPFSPFLSHLSGPSAVVYSAATGNGIACPAGSGAFGRPRMVGRSVHLEAVRSRAFSSATFVPVVGGSAMWKALRDDRIDVAYECPYEVVRRGSDDPSVVVKSCPSLAVNMLLFNLRCEALWQPGTRRAVARAIEKHELLAAVNRGVGEVAEGPIAPSSPFFVPRPPEPRRSMLDRGAPPAELTVLATKGYTAQWLEVFSEQLGRAGTRCTVREVPFEALRSALEQRSFEAALIGFPGLADPDKVLFEVFHSSGRANYSGMSDPRFDELVNRARLSHDPAERSELYADACAVIDDVVPAVFLRHGVSIIACRSGLTGLEPHPLCHLDLSKGVWRC